MKNLKKDDMLQSMTVEDMTIKYPYLNDLDYREVRLEGELEKLGYVIKGHDYVDYEYSDIQGYYNLEVRKDA